jgi:hypothetical protein
MNTYCDTCVYLFVLQSKHFFRSNEKLDRIAHTTLVHTFDQQFPASFCRSFPKPQAGSLGSLLLAWVMINYETANSKSRADPKLLHPQLQSLIM